MTGQKWDANAYATNARFVADLAGGVVDWLSPIAGERILDIGCGDGVLTQRIAQTGATVVGIDSSEAMLQSALALGVDARKVSVDELAFQHEFDAAFSNAALHWLAKERQPAALSGVHRSLKPGGRFVAEMGGYGNIAGIRIALLAVMDKFGINAEQEAASYFPSPDEYTALLSEAGFHVQRIELIPRPTPLKSGMEAWLKTFRNALFSLVPEQEREKTMTEALRWMRPVLSDASGNWMADYVRLRFKAIAN